MGTQKRTNLGPRPCDSLPWKQRGPSRAGPAVHSQCCGAPRSRAWLLVIMLPEVTSPYGNPHHLPPVFFNFGFSVFLLAWLSWHMSFRSEHGIIHDCMLLRCPGVDNLTIKWNTISCPLFLIHFMYIDKWVPTKFKTASTSSLSWQHVWGKM